MTRKIFAILLAVVFLTACRQEQPTVREQEIISTDEQAAAEQETEVKTVTPEVEKKESTTVDLTEEEKIIRGSQYSTILLSLSDDELKIENIESLKNIGSKKGNEVVDFSSTSIYGSIIIGKESREMPFGREYLYNINTNEKLTIFYYGSVTPLSNSQYAGRLLSPENNYEHEVLESVKTNYPLISNSFVLVNDDLTISEIQLDYLSVPNFSVEYVKQYLEENDEGRINSLLHYVEEKSVEGVAPLFQSVFFDNREQKYLVLYGAEFPLPLNMALFDVNGSYLETLVYGEIENHSFDPRVGVMSYGQIPLKDNNILYTGRDYSLLLDVKTKDITIVDLETTLLENGYNVASYGVEKAVLEPPFTIEEGEEAENMVIRLIEDKSQFVEMSSDYYLIDWEETDSGFNAIFGYMKNYWSDNSERIIKYDISQQPWDYRCVVE